MYRDSGPAEMRPVGGTEFVQDIVGQIDACETTAAAEIVGYADFSLGSVAVEAHVAAGDDRFRGIWCTAAWDASLEVAVARAPSSGLLLNPKWREAFACLERYDLSFGAIVYHPQLPELADLARAFPNVTIILNHVGRPLGIGPYAGKRNETFSDWQKGIIEIASWPNVVVKIGALGNPASGFDWHQRPVPPTSG